jgi:hypothetical protein
MSYEVRSNPFDIHANSILAATFSHPEDVLAAPQLSTAEKRCVLAAWASDAFAVDDNPWLRQLPGAPDNTSRSRAFCKRSVILMMMMMILRPYEAAPH